MKSLSQRASTVGGVLEITRRGNTLRVGKRGLLPLLKTPFLRGDLGSLSLRQCVKFTTLSNSWILKPKPTPARIQTSYLKAESHSRKKCIRPRPFPSKVIRLSVKLITTSEPASATGFL
ncbi:hypothetical protein RRG08_059989 [Elysia crispata]|uniref:Uncharacterized protein n=1 Tax=Elysia crispata TaxID=231223 RepID=A0AAE0YE48_9GAST|nr:hypothetical protein RRG08_059989 [Elysia crispata]